MARARGGGLKMAASPSASPAGLAGVLIETPENVDFAFAPAGLGPRSIAYGVDFVIRYSPVLALVIILSISGNLLALGDISGLAAAALAFLLFAVQWAYFTLLEFFWGGRTPGKRAAGIRVVMDGGYPLTFAAAAVRNLLRVVDSLPALYTAGIVASFVSERGKRLGDYAAGTLVVREEPFEIGYLDVIEESSRPSETASAGVVLSPARADVVARFLERRAGLDPAARSFVAQRIAEGIEPSVRGFSAAVDALFDGRAFEPFLEAVLAGAARSGRGDASVHSFVRDRKSSWLALAAFVERIDRAGVTDLSPAELREVTRLYRAAAGDLAFASTFFGATGLARFLNALVARAHNHIYRAPSGSRSALLRFFASGYPRAFQAHARFFAVSLYVFLAAAAMGALLYAADERVAVVFMGEEAVQGVREHRLWTRDIFAVTPASAASARILTNNITVTIAAFGLGLAAGVGTLYILALNGCLIGVVLMLTSAYGMSYDIWSFIGAHGFIELFIIMTAGAAGLRLASAMLAPGDLPRREALQAAAHSSVLLVLGGAPVLVVAGLVEGYISPSQALPGWLKISFGLALLAALVVYLTRPLPPPGPRRR